MEAFPVIIAVSSLIGAVITLALRYNQRYRRGWRSTIQVLYNDFTFEEYATLNLLSLIYAILLGFLTGAGFSFLVLSPFSTYNWSSYVLSALGCFLLIPIARVGLEGYSVIYKTAKDASGFFTLSTRRLVKEDPTLQEKSAWLKEIKSVRGRFGYEPSEIYSAILEELSELQIDTSSISYENTSFADNMVIVCNTSGTKVAIYSLHSDGEWTRQIV